MYSGDFLASSKKLVWLTLDGNVYSLHLWSSHVTDVEAIPTREHLSVVRPI